MAQMRTESGLPAANGLQYLGVLARLHETLDPSWYFEVGTQTGASFKLSRARSISVDPQYLLKHEIVGDKPECHLFQQTSDDFFASGALGRLGCTIDLAFLDGMHLYEYLLRGFMHTEKAMSPDGVIVLHDCLPATANMAVRNRDECTTRAWTGDVWKLVPILRHYRPDLTLEILDAAPTGLVLVSNLDPDSTILDEAYPEIVDRYHDMPLEADVLLGDLTVQSASRCRWLCDNHRDLPRGGGDQVPIFIKIAAPDKSVMKGWGDYFFARGLARAFGRLGHPVLIQPASDWYDDRAPGAIDLVLRGRTNFKRIEGRTSLFWAISKPMRATNYPQADHVFFASRRLYETACAEQGADKVSFLPQAFENEGITPRKALRGDGVVFVGRRRLASPRPVVEHAINSADVPDLDLWGPGWDSGASAPYHRGDFVENAQIGALYGAADIVLNDHTVVMREAGFLSNRIFDILASGAVPVTDAAPSLPEGLEEYVYCFSDQESFDAAIRAARSESDEKRQARLDLAARLGEAHSFDARARQILTTVEALSRYKGVA